MLLAKVKPFSFFFGLLLGLVIGANLVLQAQAQANQVCAHIDSYTVKTNANGSLTYTYKLSKLVFSNVQAQIRTRVNQASLFVESTGW